MIDDGGHHISVVVTPLQEPFTVSVMKFRFTDDERMLAVSKADGEKIMWLLGHKLDKREIKMEAVGNEQIKISLSD